MTTSCDSAHSSSTQRSTLTDVSLEAPSYSSKNEGQNIVFSQYSDKSCPKDYDVPFFTVARYRNPKSPMTFEIAAVTSFDCESSKGVQESVKFFEKIYSNKFEKEPHAYNGQNGASASADNSFSQGNEFTKEWLGKSFNISHSNSASGSFAASQHESLPGKENIKTNLSRFLNSSVDDVTELLNNSNSISVNSHFSKTEDTCEVTPVRGFIDFFESSSSKVVQKRQSKTKKDAVRRRVSTPLSSSDICENNRLSTYRKNSLTEESLGNSYDRNTIEKDPKTYSENSEKTTSAKEVKIGAYEDAGVTDAAEKLENLPPLLSSNQQIQNQSCHETSNPREKNNVPEKKLERAESEYLIELHKKITESHERQLVPLQEDLADWLSKLLDENLTSVNLISKLETGILLCKLAKLVSEKAQEARNKSLSNLEVPTLPYKTWGHARTGTFFARDNISNFLRFCRRLGVHSNLLFETEDLVCKSGVRRVVLCLLEVGRLSHLWWNVEPPGLVKLEKEFDKKDFEQRQNDAELQQNSEVSQDNKTSSPRLPRLSDIRSRPRVYKGRGIKPIPPPKPASITKAVTSVVTRPKSFATSNTSSRGWSGAHTTPTTPVETPTTPVETPTHTSKTRLPVAKTPMSSGKCTPNTTPTTPTQTRRYLVSCERNKPKDFSKIINRNSKPPSYCSKMATNTSQLSGLDAQKEAYLDLDKQVANIAEQSKGFCTCKFKDCDKHHIKKIADGIYEFHGKNVFVRLLKGKHVMVRVGGGWDTLEHYLMRHYSSQMKLSKAKLKASYPERKYYQKSHISANAEKFCQEKCSKGRTNASPIGPVKHCNDEGQTGSETACQQGMKIDNKGSREGREGELKSAKSKTEEPSQENSLRESYRLSLSDSGINVDDSPYLDSDPHVCSHMNEMWACDLSAPMGEDGNFQSTSFPLDDMLMASSQSLDLV